MVTIRLITTPNTSTHFDQQTDALGLFRVSDVEKPHLETTSAYHRRIREECQQITPEVHVRMFENMKRRVNLCLDAEGQYFGQLL